MEATFFLLAACVIWFVYAWILCDRAERHVRRARALLSANDARLLQIETAENRAKDHARVVAELRAEANANRWRRAVLEGQAS